MQSQIQDNQNANLIMDGIKGNTAAIQTLAANLNCDFNTLNSAVCDVKNGISQLGGQIGFSTEKIVNAVLMGNNQMIQALQNCCCQTQQAILKMGYEQQLATCHQTNDLQTAIRLDGEATRGAIADFRHAWEQSRYDEVLADKNRLQTVLDLRDQQNATAGMINAAVTPLAQGVAAVTQQVQNIASHQLPTYPQPYVPGYPYNGYGGTGFWN